MAEVLDRGVIEIVGDARKLRVAIEDAKKQVRTLGEGQRDISRSASASIDRYIGRLSAQNQLLGKSARETELFNLALRGASQEQLRTADAALRFAENQAKSAAALQSLKTGFIALGAIAATALVGAAVAFDRLIKQAGEFQDLAEKVGDTADNFASLAVAAKVGGTSMNEVAAASIRLTKGLTGVDDESEAAGAAVKALGLDLAALKTLAPAEQFETIANALAEFEDGASKTAVAVALFGKAGAEMLPFLKELAGETGRQNILTAEQIALADEYADKQARLQAQISLYAQVIATEMLPAYVDLQGAFLDVIKGMTGVSDGASKLASDNSLRTFADNAARAFAFVLDSLDGIVRAFQIAGKSIGGFGAVMERITRLDFRGALEAANAFREDIGAVLNRQTFQGALESRIAARNVQRDTNLTPPQDRRALNFQGAVKKAGASKDDSDALARAQLQLDLERIKEAGDAQVDAFRRAESIMQAMRSASLVDDRDYFASKLGFIQSFAREEEAALQAQIERRQREVFTGKNAQKEQLDNEREIAKLQAQIAKIRADAVAKTKINEIEAEAAIQKIRQAYLDARDAAQAYLDTIARRNAREIEGIGRGQRFREVNAGRGEIDDRAQAERRRLEGELRRQQISREQFEQYLAVVEDTYQREVEMYEQRTATLELMQRDWLAGASEALENYLDNAKDIAKQFEDVFTRGFQNLEDLLLDFANVNFKTWKDAGEAVSKFALSVANDLARIEIRQQITGPLAEWLKENGRLERLGEIVGLQRPGIPAGATAVPVVEQTIAKADIPGFDQAANAAQFTTAVTTAGTTVATTLTTAATTAATTLTGEVTAAGATFSAESTAAGASITAAGASFSATVTAAATQFASTVSSASGATAGADALSDIFGGLGFAEGGPVAGPGTPTSDSIPAMLSNQEFVVKAAKATEPGASRFLQIFNDHGLAAALSQTGRESKARAAVGSVSRVVPFAKGGIIDRHEYFPLPDGKTGLRGEAGPEAIMPLRRGIETGAQGVIVAGLPGVTLPVIRDAAGNMAVEMDSSALIERAMAAPVHVSPTLTVPAARLNLPDIAIKGVMPNAATVRPEVAHRRDVVTRAAHAINAGARELREQTIRERLISGPQAPEPIRPIVPPAPATAAPLALSAVRTSIHPSIAIDAPERVIGAPAVPSPKVLVMPGGRDVERFSRTIERGAAVVPSTAAQRVAVAVTAAALSMPLAAAPVDRLIERQTLSERAASIIAGPSSVDNSIANTMAGGSVTNNNAGAITNIAQAAPAAAPVVSVAPVLGSFEQGTRFVPQTGHYLLHQGEAVVPKNDNGQTAREGDINITVHMPATDMATANQVAVRIGNQVALARARRLSGGPS